MNDYVFTLSSEPEVYVVQGVGNLDRPVQHQIRIKIKVMSAAASTTAARVANLHAGAMKAKAGDANDKTFDWKSCYLEKFQEESFVQQIDSIENIRVIAGEAEAVRDLTDPRELWNSQDSTMAEIATEIQIYMSSKSELPVKNSK